ncbi:MAG: hypothetical protein ACRC2U_15480 [Aeromonas sp.]
MKTVTKLPAKKPKAPDAILVELWEHKRQINREANYDIDTLVRTARKQAARALSAIKKSKAS